MTIICSAYFPEGIVMGADSRMLCNKDLKDKTVDEFIASDNAEKLILINNKIGISCCGDAKIDNRFIGSYLKEFIGENEDLSAIKDKLSSHIKSLKERLPESNIILHISGYIDGEPKIFRIENEECTEVKTKGVSSYAKEPYALIYDGMVEPIKKIRGDKGTEQELKINWNNMHLRDCIEFIEYLIDLTIKYYKFSEGTSPCGGNVDILFINKREGKFIKHKIYNC